MKDAYLGRFAGQASFTSSCLYLCQFDKEDTRYPLRKLSSEKARLEKNKKLSIGKAITTVSHYLWNAKLGKLCSLELARVC